MKTLFRSVVITVAAAHLLLLSSALTAKPREKIYAPPHIHVRTRTLSEGPPQTKAAVVSPKKAPERKVAPSKPAPKKSPAKKFAKEIEQNLALPSSIPLTVPKPIDFSKEIHDDLGSTVYQDLLTETLREQLKLPVPGTVKLKLTLNRSGHVKTVEILSGESEANRAYLEVQLKLLVFPLFSGDLEGIDEQTFLLSFCSD